MTCATAMCKLNIMFGKEISRLHAQGTHLWPMGARNRRVEHN